MYAEFSQVSLLGMSNPEPLVAKYISPSSSSLLTKEGKEEEMDAASARKETQEDKKKELGAGGDDDDDDGFKTPTSSEHKIPEPKTCPPAPRRPRPLKRKAPPTHSSSAAALVVGNLLQLQLDFSKRVRKASTQEKQ